MAGINGISSNPPGTIKKVNRVKPKDGVEIKLSFDPQTLGAVKNKNGQYPPTKAVTENQVEAALLKHFGFNADNPADINRVKKLLDTEGSPFDHMKTSGGLTAVFNKRTGKYEISDLVEKSLHKQLQGKAAEVKQQIETERQKTTPPPTTANPNELIAAKNGITNNSRAELEAKWQNNPPKEQPFVSAPKESDRAVKGITDTIESVTGTSDPFAASEVGKQFNRLSVSALRLTGKAMEASNYFSEKINDAIRYAAPDSVDALLDKVDQNNRENAQALQNANSSVTSEDSFIDGKARKEGRSIPVTEDLANKVMYFPEGIPNAIDSAIKGDFKDDDGSYSDKVGKIIGGLNPVGDIRDIIANGKGVFEGKNGAWIGLGASIIGAVPIIGDGGKIVMKAEKEAIAEVAEKLIKGGVEKEAAEKLAKEEVGRLTKEAEGKLAKQEVKTSGKLIIEEGRTLSASEKGFADKMVAEGKVVKAPKEVNAQNVKNPDFEIDGKIVEFKYVSDLKGKDVDTLSSGLSRRILDGGSQASRVTLNVTDQAEMTKEVAERSLKRAFGSLRKRNSDAIKEVRIYGKDFDITVPYKK